jgi:hypothetical protein
MRIRTIGSGLAAIGLALGINGTVLAAQPEVVTWTNHVDVPYFSCGTFEAHGVWAITHHLTLYVDQTGTAIRDTEVVDFSGAFVNPVSGASIADSGRITYFDTLDADGNYLTTMANVVRHSAYLHSAGRTDYQSGRFVGIDRFDAGLADACAALGAA